MSPHQQNHTTPDAEVVIESALTKSEQFIEKNGKNLLIALAVIVLLVGGYYAYKYLWNSPREVQASNMMFVAEQQFAIDSFNLALNGDGNNAGFIDVIDQYESTPQGNIAKHYAGICLLKLNDLDGAIDYLSQYTPTEGVPNEIINAQNRGLMGDIYSQKGELENAAEYYMEAVGISDNTFTAPYYLKKAGLVYAKLNQYKEAMNAFQSIADNFPSSMEARDIDKFIGQIEQK